MNYSSNLTTHKTEVSGSSPEWPTTQDFSTEYNLFASRAAVFKLCGDSYEISPY